MCGIAGFCSNPKDHIDARKLSAALFRGIVIRGKDATGAAWYNAKSEEVCYAKRNVPAPAFINHDLKMMPSGVKNVILHTRYATQGSPENENNNHPIVIDNLVGVHNGHISNDNKILARYPQHKRIGQVDSEAAFAIAKYEENYLEALTTIQGRAALAWIDGDRPKELNLARVEGSPLFVAQTPNGSTIFASTQPILERAMKESGLKIEWLTEMAEYEYMKIRGGAIMEYTEFKPQWKKDYEIEQDALFEDDLTSEYGAWLKSVM